MKYNEYPLSARPSSPTDFFAIQLATKVLKWSGMWVVDPRTNGTPTLAFKDGDGVIHTEFQPWRKRFDAVGLIQATVDWQLGDAKGGYYKAWVGSHNAEHKTSLAMAATLAVAKAYGVAVPEEVSKPKPAPKGGRK